MISEKEVEKIASLARLQLSEKEKSKFRQDLAAVLDFVEKLKELNVEKVLPTTSGAATTNVMRADQPKERGEREEVEAMLEQIPERKERFVKVKSILNKEK